MKRAFICIIFVGCVGAGIAATFFFKKKNLNSETNTNSTEASQFGEITTESRGELFLKNTKDFIFESIQGKRAVSQNDTVLVGADAKGRVKISKDYGGGEIELSENSIVSFSTREVQNADGTKSPKLLLRLKQGSIRRVKTPKTEAKNEVTSQTADTSVAVPPADVSRDVASAVPTASAMPSSEILVEVESEGQAESSIVELSVENPVVGKAATVSPEVVTQSSTPAAQDVAVTDKKTTTAIETPVKSSSELASKEVTEAPHETPPQKTDNGSGVKKNTLFKRGAVVALTPVYSLTALSAEDRTTGSDSTVASNYNTGVHISYMQEWTESTRTFVNLSLGLISFEKPTDSTKTINDDKKFLSGLGAGLNLELTDRFNLEVGGYYQKELFVRASSTQSITIDAMNVPSIGGNLSYAIVKLDPFTFGASSSLYVKGPAKTDGYNVRLGAQYGAIIYLKQSLVEVGQESNFQTELGFISRSQDTSIIKQTQTEITLGLRILFPVGRKQEGGAEL